MRKVLLLSGCMFCFVCFVFAQKTASQKPASNSKAGGKISILNAIEIDNETTTSKIVIHQDSRIDNLLNTYVKRIDPTMPYSGPGYRVQVFSSNNYKTAKNDAERIENQLRSAFPRHQVYISYASPFWKVRIGNFRTSGEAQKLRSEIIQLFPELRKDCYAVRENNVKTN